MKHVFSLLFIISLFFSITSCQDKEDQEADFRKIREIAFKHLNASEQETIVGDWRDAFVRINASGNYEVYFSTTQDMVLGPIVLEIDSETKKVIKVYPRR